MNNKKEKTSSYQLIPIDRIDIEEKWNVRTLDKEKKIDELAESIAEYGLLQPIVVFEQQDRYKLIIGQRRYRACKRLHRGEIPAIVIKKQDEEKAKILSLSENIHRVELNRADIVEVIDFLYLRNNKSAKRVSDLLGVSPPTVYSYLKIEQAPNEIKQMYSKREINKQDVKRIMELAPDDKDKMIELAQEMKKLAPPERKKLAEIGKFKPEAKAKELAEEAKKPRIEEKVIVPLTPPLFKALNNAVKKIGLTREEIAQRALKEWLGNKGYYKE